VYTFILIACLLLFSLVAWRNRHLALALLAAFLPAYLLRFSIAGIPMTLLEGFILILVACWLLRGEWHAVKSLPRLWTLAALAMLAAAIVATVVAPDHRAALGILKAYFVEPILLFFMAATTGKTEQEKERVLFGFCLAAAFASMIGMIQFITGAGIPIPWDIERRVTGPFPYPNALGLFAGPAVIVAAFRAYATQKLRRIQWTTIAIVCTLGVLLAQTEAALVAITVTLFVASLFVHRLRRFIVPLTAVGMMLVLLIPTWRAFAFEKLSFQDYSGRVRRAQWEETGNMLRDRLLFGAGLAGYQKALVPYHTHQENEIFAYPHTLVLNVWSELGLPGLVAFAYLAWIVFVSSVKTFRLRREHGMVAPAIAFSCFAALFEMTIHGLADAPYFKNDLAALTWLLLALLMLSSSYERRPIDTHN